MGSITLEHVKKSFGTNDMNSFSERTIQFRFGPLVFGVAFAMTLAMGLFAGLLGLIIPITTQVIFDTAQGQFVYVITGHSIVKPNQVEILQDKGDNRITLIACNPKYSAKERYILVALPFLSIAAAYALTRAVTWARERVPALAGQTPAGRLAPALLAAAALALPLPELVATRQQLRLPDSRHLARRWIMSHIDRGTPCAIGFAGLDGLRVEVVGNAVVAGTLQPPNHVGTHPPKTDHR